MRVCVCRNKFIKEKKGTGGLVWFGLAALNEFSREEKGMYFLHKKKKKKDFSVLACFPPSPT